MIENLNCYNIAYNYLKDKYGYRKIGHNETFNKKLRIARNAKERNILLKNVTDNDFNIVLNNVPNPEAKTRDREIELLLDQYKYNTNVINVELYRALVSVGVIEYK